MTGDYIILGIFGVLVLVVLGFIVDEWIKSRRQS